MLLRRFNPAGVERFRAFIAALRADGSLPVPIEMLTDGVLTEAIDPPTDCPDARFPNRLAVAEYLDRVLTPAGLAESFEDVGLWAWLALRFFDQLCPTSSDGVRSPGSDVKWVPQVDVNRRYYRHLLMGAAVVYQAHRDDPESVVGLLADPVHVGTSEVFRSFVENPSLIRSKSAVEAATTLYYDRARGKIRRGAGGEGRWSGLDRAGG